MGETLSVPLLLARITGLNSLCRKLSWQLNRSWLGNIKLWMRTTSKSPRRVLLAAYAAAAEALPPYRHPNSPKKFTQPQLFACLVLKEFLRLDYRGLACFLVDVGNLTGLIGLSAVPDLASRSRGRDRQGNEAAGREEVKGI